MISTAPSTEGGGGGLAGGLGGFKDKLDAVGSSLPIVGGAAAAAGSALVGLVGGAVSSAAELGRLSETTGLSVETLSALNNVAKTNGVELDELTEGFKTMTEIQADAANGSASAAEKLDLLGLSIGDIQGLGPEELFKKFADAVGSIENPTQRTAAAQIAFGGDAAALFAILDGGNLTFDEAIAKGQEYGIVTEENAEAAQNLQAQIAGLQVEFENTATQVIPALVTAMQGANAVLDAYSDSILGKAHGALLGLVSDSGSAEGATRSLEEAVAASTASAAAAAGAYGGMKSPLEDVVVQSEFAASASGAFQAATAGAGGAAAGAVANIHALGAAYNSLASAANAARAAQAAANDFRTTGDLFGGRDVGGPAVPQFFQPTGRNYTIPYE